MEPASIAVIALVVCLCAAFSRKAERSPLAIRWQSKGTVAAAESKRRSSSAEHFGCSGARTHEVLVL